MEPGPFLRSHPGGGREGLVVVGAAVAAERWLESPVAPVPFAGVASGQLWGREQYYMEAYALLW